MINLIAKDIALKADVSLPSSASLKDVVELMNKNREGVVVLLEGDKPVGIITERDILSLFAQGYDLSEPAINHGAKNLVTVDKDEPVLSCLGKMVSKDIRRLVVLDGDRFVGVITQRRILNLEDMIFMLDLKVFHLIEGKSLITVPPNRTLKEALTLMRDSRIGALPVVEDGVLKGIITESDVLKFIREGVSPEARVGEFMTRSVITSLPSEPVSAVYKKMKAKNIRRIVIVNEKNTPVGIVTHRDIARSIAIDYIQSLEKKIAAMKSLVNDIPEIVLEVEEKEGGQFITWANRYAKEKLGDIVGREPRLLLSDRDWNRIYAKLRMDRKISERVITDKVVWSVSGIYVEVGRRGFIQLFLKDITEEFKRAFVDPLTGVYNSKFLEEFLKKEIEWAKRFFKGMSLLCLKFSTPPVDDVLKLTAGILVKNLRRYDLVARVGSDTFYVLLPDTPKEVAFQVCERIRRKLMDVSETLNISLYSYPEDFTEFEGFLFSVKRTCED